MRLGGPVFVSGDDPALWAKAHRQAGYSTVYLPDDETWAMACAKAAGEEGLVIAEVGAWSNPISHDPAERQRAIDLCCRRLDLAERAGARCCVNIAGSRGMQWDGPDVRNLDDQTFDMIVQSVRQIINAVKPRNTFYTLETMPWIFPDSADSYLRLLSAIDRRQFAVHLDVVNLVNSPAKAFGTAALIRECFAKLGPHIRSCHAKDIRISGHLTLHLDECVPGEGLIDYRAYLSELDHLDPDTPLMLEHLPDADTYAKAAAHIRTIAELTKVVIR